MKCVIQYQVAPLLLSRRFFKAGDFFSTAREGRRRRRRRKEEKTDVARRNDENISDSKSHVITASKVRAPEDKSV